MKLKLIKFRFKTPLHIGTVRADMDTSESTIHSDTLYSSIIMAWSLLGVKHPMLTGENEDGKIPDTGFTLSSLFPFYQKIKETEPILFFPKPIGTLQPEDYETHKKLKQIKYVDIDYFKHLLVNGQINTKSIDTDAEVHGDYLTRNPDIAYMKRQEDKEGKPKKKSDFITCSVSPRVYVPRYQEQDKKGELIDDTTIFYMERIYFTGESGFFCLAEFDNEDTEIKVCQALNFLEDEGLGSDRNTGNGTFEYTIEPFNGFDDILKQKTEYKTTLSLFCPKNRDTLEHMIGKDAESKSAYELIKRGGWVTASPYLNYRKNSVYMMQVGSVLKTNAVKAGETVDLRPKNTEVNHPIYRVGKSLFLPINI